MKAPQSFMRGSPQQLLLCAVLLILTGCATESPVAPLPTKVVRLKYEYGARYSNDGGKTWQRIKGRSTLSPGFLIETADSGSYVDLRLGEPATAARGTFDLPPRGAQMLIRKSPSLTPAPDKFVRLWASSQLRLDRLTRSQSQGTSQPTEQIELDLHCGRIFLQVKGMAVDSTFEIKYPNGFVRIGNGIYQVEATGIVKVAEGRALVTRPGSPTPQVVLGNQQFDARTGVLMAIPDLEGFSSVR